MPGEEILPIFSGNNRKEYNMINNIFDFIANEPVNPSVFASENFTKGKEIPELTAENIIEFCTANNFYILNEKSRKCTKYTFGICIEYRVEEVMQYIGNWLKNISIVNNSQQIRFFYSEFLKKYDKNNFLKVLDFLPKFDIPQFKDDEFTDHKFFRNGIVRIDKDTLSIRSWEDFGKTKHYVSIDEVIDCDVKTIDLDKLYQFRKCDFGQFIYNVCCGEDGFNPDKYQSLKSFIGYLLHNYKSPVKPYICILTDEQEEIEESALGRTGKGIITNSVKQLRTIVEKNGKEFKFTTRFAYAGVTKNTKIFVIDDAVKQLKMEKLYSMSSGSWEIEKKGVDSYTIPFEDAPKLLISTNYGYYPKGDSDKSRIWQVALDHYYNSERTPDKEIGRIFFSHDWDSPNYENSSNTEWDYFYNFMFSCIQCWLKNGRKDFISKKTENILFRRMIKNDGLYNYLVDNIEKDINSGLKIIDYMSHANDYLKLNPTEGKFQSTLPLKIAEFMLKQNGISFIRKREKKKKLLALRN